MTEIETSLLLDARNLGYARNGLDILSGVDVTVEPGERLAVTGPSGSGKSSLLALLAGLAAPDTGEIRVDGQLLTGLSGPAPGTAMILQGYGLVSLLTASENVEIALRAAAWSPIDARTAAVDALQQVGLDDHADHLVEELSGGQQQRCAVARALALQPRLLIADEPTAELDRATRTLVLSRLLEVADRGGAIVLATHDDDVARRCDRIFDLRPQARNKPVPEQPIT